MTWSDLLLFIAHIKNVFLESLSPAAKKCNKTHEKMTSIVVFELCLPFYKALKFDLPRKNLNHPCFSLLNSTDSNLPQRHWTIRKEKELLIFFSLYLLKHTKFSAIEPKKTIFIIQVFNPFFNFRSNIEISIIFLNNKKVIRERIVLVF